MRARYNEVTGAILEALAKGGGTAQALADAVDASEGTVLTTLLRLFRARHVDRKRIREGTVTIDKEEKVTRPRYVYHYSITERGRERLERIQASP